MLEKLLGPKMVPKIFFEVSALQDVRHCPKLQSCAISRKLMNQIWKNNEKHNFRPDLGPIGPNLGPKKFFREFNLH